MKLLLGARPSKRLLGEGLLLVGDSFLLGNNQPCLKALKETLGRFQVFLMVSGCFST